MLNTDERDAGATKKKHIAYVFVAEFFFLPNNDGVAWVLTSWPEMYCESATNKKRTIDTRMKNILCNFQV